jgi:hypothetical protein
LPSSKVVYVVLVALVIRFIAIVTFAAALLPTPSAVLTIRGGIAFHDPMNESGKMSRPRPVSDKRRYTSLIYLIIYRINEILLPLHLMLHALG